ncbi:MAG TPA: 3-hydroxyacyl-CoA dehydrogenase family protein [Chitinophagaceae bacterium]|nr:3-hydroxyacyl-CoA dehydrogenase family protein [Chitinophagaceae bacterium]
MRIAILTTENQKHEIIDNKNAGSEIDLVFMKNISEMGNFAEFDAFFLLTDTIPVATFEDLYEKPVIINSVVNTLKSTKLPFNVSRINGWPGFLKRSIWEIASNSKAMTEIVFKSLGWNILFVKDEPGFVSARVLSMIINEAYFALGENVSTINEIDLAMKLGTNYPFSPFEWQEKIGIQNIYMLLKKLSETNKRYLIAPLLEQEFKKFTSSHLE